MFNVIGFSNVVYEDGLFPEFQTPRMLLLIIFLQVTYRTMSLKYLSSYWSNPTVRIYI